MIMGASFIHYWHCCDGYNTFRNGLQPPRTQQALFLYMPDNWGVWVGALGWVVRLCADSAWDVSHHPALPTLLPVRAPYGVIRMRSTLHGRASNVSVNAECVSLFSGSLRVQLRAV